MFRDDRMSPNDIRNWKASIERAKKEVLKCLKRRTKPIDFRSLVSRIPATYDRTDIALKALSRSGKVRYIRAKKKCRECGRLLPGTSGWVLVVRKTMRQKGSP
jgi:hypothetical protein